MANYVYASHIGHIFLRVIRAGAASRRPYEEKSRSKSNGDCDGGGKFKNPTRNYGAWDTRKAKATATAIAAQSGRDCCLD
jgi:hypothetical protein